MANIADSITTVFITKDTVIEDVNLEPYFIIAYQEGGYAVCEKRLTGKGELTFKVECYPGKIKSCLDTIAKLKINNGTHYESIRAYIQEWEKVIRQLNDSVKI